MIDKSLKCFIWLPDIGLIVKNVFKTAYSILVKCLPDDCFCDEKNSLEDPLP